MRSLVLASILSATALGACGQQSLTDNKTGTGGVGATTGTGGAGAVTGTGGSTLQMECDALATEYQVAVTAAQSCTLGGTSQCQIAVPAVLSVCGSCPVFVNDATKPNAIQAQWENAGCLKASPPVPCVQSLCLARPSMCVAGPTGAMCASVSGGGGASGGGSGGDSGKGGSVGTDGGVSTCDALAEKYQAVLAVAHACTVGAANQCGQPVPSWLTVCGTCQTYVTDATELNQIQAAWNQAGCASNVAVACPLSICLPPASASCVATDGGSGTCADSPGMIPPNAF